MQHNQDRGWDRDARGTGMAAREAGSQLQVPRTAHVQAAHLLPAPHTRVGVHQAAILWGFPCGHSQPLRKQSPHTEYSVRSLKQVGGSPDGSL